MKTSHHFLPCAAAVAALLAGTATPASAQSMSAAPRPSPKPGDTRTYRTVDLFTGIEGRRFSLEFLREDAVELRFKATDLKTGRTRTFGRTFDLGSCSSSKDIPERKCASHFSFPMQVGDRHDYDHLPSREGYTGATCKVEAAEKVTVPAGTFDAFRVECSGRWTYTGARDAVFQGRWRDTNWYAPAINAQVKYIERAYPRTGGMDKQILTELVSFKSGSELAAQQSGSTSPPAGSGSDSVEGRAASTNYQDSNTGLEPMPSEFAAGTTRFKGTFFRDPGNPGYSGTGRVAWVNGDLYEGQLTRGSREGVGKFSWSDGQQYEGEWRRDQPDGHGKLVFVNGDTYDGAVKAGAPSGEGRMAYASGDKYVGRFDNGVPEGRGRYAWANGQTLDGVWVHGKGHGAGVLIYANGDHYNGELAVGAPDGAGRMNYASGDVYVGDFKAGKPEGMGTYTWKVGGQYVGGWKAGSKEGRGALTWANGGRWEGLFVGDQRTEGTMVEQPR